MPEIIGQSSRITSVWQPRWFFRFSRLIATERDENTRITAHAHGKQAVAETQLSIYSIGWSVIEFASAKIDAHLSSLRHGYRTSCALNRVNTTRHISFKLNYPKLGWLDHSDRDQNLVARRQQMSCHDFHPPQKTLEQLKKTSTSKSTLDQINYINPTNSCSHEDIQQSSTVSLMNRNSSWNDVSACVTDKLTFPTRQSKAFRKPTRHLCHHFARADETSTVILWASFLLINHTIVFAWFSPHMMTTMFLLTWQTHRSLQIAFPDQHIDMKD